METEDYHRLAALLEFPVSSVVDGARALGERLADRYPDAATEVQRFCDGLSAALSDQQELYTRTFDIQAITTLDIGYILFGDDFKRAELLSHLTREHGRVGNDCRGELADHLPNVVRLLPSLTDQELLAELVGDIVAPAVMLMIREFDPERIATKNGNYRTRYKTLIAPAPGCDPTIYRRAFNALLDVLTTDFPVAEKVERFAQWSANRSGGFLGSLVREMDIEGHANPTNSGSDA